MLLQNRKKPVYRLAGGRMDRLCGAIQDADAVIIGAGAGLSASAGFVYDGERFAQYFRDFEEKYGFHDMYTGGFFPYAAPEEHWAYWSRYIWVNRYMDAPKPVYQKLLRLVRGKDCFVLTTNVDHCFQKAGFDQKRLFCTQGDYGLFQCSEPCCQETWENKSVIQDMMEFQENMRIPAELIPRCPQCGKPLTMNLRSDEKFVQDEDWYRAADRYDVMTAIGVIDGYDDGSFDPDGVLTREEAAKLICAMLLGDEADSLSSSSSSFTDVDASRWSSPYIEYCVSLGIIAGAGDGNFYPTEQLTGYAFAKMLLIALGYDAEREGYTGTSWTVNVASDATSAGIDQDGLMMSSGLSREGAAQMCLNTLEADMVSYSGSSSTTVSTGDGTSIVISGSAEEINNSESDDYRTDSEDRDDIQQFCEY